MSTTTTPPTTVTEGLYYGYSAAEIDAELAKYKAAVGQYTTQRQAAGGGDITFIASNGKQVSYNHAAALRHLTQWRHDIENAQAILAGVCQPRSDRAVARFQ